MAEPISIYIYIYICIYVYLYVYLSWHKTSLTQHSDALGRLGWFHRVDGFLRPEVGQMHHRPHSEGAPERSTMNQKKTCLATTVRITLNHYEPLQTLINHYKSLFIVTNHYESLLITSRKHHKPSLTITNHFESLFWITMSHSESLNHHESLWITMNHPESVWITMNHYIYHRCFLTWRSLGVPPFLFLLLDVHTAPGLGGTTWLRYLIFLGKKQIHQDPVVKL